VAADVIKKTVERLGRMLLGTGEAKVSAYRGAARGFGLGRVVREGVHDPVGIL